MAMVWPRCVPTAAGRARRPDGQLRRGRARHRNAGRHRRRQGLVRRQERAHPRRHPRQGCSSTTSSATPTPGLEGRRLRPHQPADRLPQPQHHTATYIRGVGRPLPRGFGRWKLPPTTRVPTASRLNMIPQTIYWAPRMCQALRAQNRSTHRERLRLRRQSAVENSEVIDLHRRDYVRNHLREVLRHLRRRAHDGYSGPSSTTTVGRQLRASFGIVRQRLQDPDAHPSSRPATSRVMRNGRS